MLHFAAMNDRLIECSSLCGLGWPVRLSYIRVRLSLPDSLHLNNGADRARPLITPLSNNGAKKGRVDSTEAASIVGCS